MKSFSFLEPFEKEGLNLKNRLVMTAMTRNFSDPDHNPTIDMLAYYKRRAKNGVGLILTEGTIIHPSGDGSPTVPYIYTEKQIVEWGKIVEAIHKEGTKIFCQLWHCGRISHPDFLNGALPVSASNLAPEGIFNKVKKPFVSPHALTIEELGDVVEMFAQATKNAIRAGFDGVEIHAGHGYLLDGFFDSNVNNRTDQYGGSIENRCRFPLMVIRRVLEIAGPFKVSVRISPSREMNGIYEWPDIQEMIAYLIPELDNMGLKILDVSCARSDYEKTSSKVIRLIRPKWSHILMGGASLSPEGADKEIKDGFIDLVTYGRFIIANPDFVEKITNEQTLVTYNNEMLKVLY